MKTIRIIKYAILALVLFSGCSKENESSRVQEDDMQTYTQEIPVTFEGMEDTKMTLDAGTGACTWTEMDNIALDTSTGWYYAPVVGSSVRLNLASGQERVRYATYPGFSPFSHDYTSTITRTDPPSVSYQSGANYNGKSNDWMWAPMIAENTGETLKFFHVGGLVRITVNNLPSNYNSMYVYFYGKRVTGSFTVSDAGTADASTEAADATSSYVSITNLTNSGSGFYANIPIPAGDYSALTQIKVVVGGSATYTQSIYFPNGWGEIKHGEGRTLTFDMSGSVSGGDGTINATEHYKPHWLKWNDLTSKYEIFDDPLELMVHSTTDDIDVYYHHFYNNATTTPSATNMKSIRYRVLGDCISTTIPPIPIDGRYYHLLSGQIRNKYDGSDNTSTEVYKFLRGSSGSTVNGNSIAYGIIKVLVDLSDATPENGAAQDYRNKGRHTSAGAISTNTNYVCGYMILSNNMTIVHPNLQTSSFAKPSGAIPYTFYKQLIDAGCFFIPCLTTYSSTSLQNYPWISTSYFPGVGVSMTFFKGNDWANSTSWSSSLFSQYSNYSQSLVDNFSFAAIVLEGQS